MPRSSLILDSSSKHVELARLGADFLQHLYRSPISFSTSASRSAIASGRDSVETSRKLRRSECRVTLPRLRGTGIHDGEPRGTPGAASCTSVNRS